MTGRAQCLAQLGTLAGRRLEAIVAAGQAEEAMREHLDNAIEYYEAALDLLPSYELEDLATMHMQLGTILRFSLHEFDRAQDHLREAIRTYEEAGSLGKAAGARRNMAGILMGRRRYSEAKEYAEAARRGYLALGPSATADVRVLDRLLREIEEEDRA